MESIKWLFEQIALSKENTRDDQTDFYSTTNGIDDNFEWPKSST